MSEYKHYTIDMLSLLFHIDFQDVRSTIQVEML